MQQLTKTNDLIENYALEQESTEFFSNDFEKAELTNMLSTIKV